jgi:molybdenum cofactor guanylyltransferase
VKCLGAVIAGGKSLRFGSDKAVAIVDGLPLIDHVVMGLYRHAEAVVIAGRGWRDSDVVDDGDFAGQGPLAGLLAALDRAEAAGFHAVLSAPCDALPMPDYDALIGAGAAVFEEHWLFGFWPVAVAAQLRAHLEKQADRSVRRWLDVCGARRVESSVAFHNFNTPEDVAAFEKGVVAHA